MFKSLLKILDHTFPMFCVGLFLMSTVAMAMLPAMSKINADVQNYNNQYGEVKNNDQD